MKPSDKFIKLVEWSDEDACYVGSIPGFLGPCCHGDNEENVYKELIKILDEWVLIHQKDGIPLPEATSSKSYSGKFLLRIKKDLHKLLSLKAMQNNLSLNQFCERIFEKAIFKKKVA